MAAVDFVIPSSIQDLERAPFHLQPYPESFDEEERVESFQRLVELLDNGNQVLAGSGYALFAVAEGEEEEEDEEPWMDQERLQALYTLVRKSTSLTDDTRRALAQAIAFALEQLGYLLQEAKKEATVSASFRNAWTVHLYMFYTLTVFVETHCAGNKENNIRAVCAPVWLTVATLHRDCRHTLWPRGVAMEAVTVLPTRVAYRWLELCTGVNARRAACGDEALQILAAHTEGVTQMTAALMDLMHSFEHMAPLVAELCCSCAPTVVTELLREYARLEVTTGLKNVAPFLAHLAAVRPATVAPHLPALTALLQRSDFYPLRSAVVTAVGHVAQDRLASLQQSDNNDDDNQANTKDSNKDPRKASQLEQIFPLLDLLMERAHDVSSYTRSTVLKALINLAASLPKDRILAVTAVAIDRLQDKTVLVRKQALQLLTTLLEHNPYNCNLDPEPYQAKLEELYTYVQAHIPDDLAQAYQQALVDGDGTEETAIELERATLAAALAESDQWMTTSQDSLTAEQQEFCTKVQALRFTQAVLDFVAIFENAAGALDGMLLSASTSDVTAALRLFVKARQFGLPCAVTGMKRALALMWSPEAAIRTEVLTAFGQVFLVASNGTPWPPAQIARNLLVLVDQATVSELASIEEAVVHLVQEGKGELPPGVFVQLWKVVRHNGEGVASALQLIAMGARADRSIVDAKSRLKLILDNCLQSRDWPRIRAASVLLQRLNVSVEENEDSAKALVLERIMEQLAHICVAEDCGNDTDQWFSTSQQAIKALFVICREPEAACRNMLTGMQTTTFVPENRDSLTLARFFHILGETALNLLVYTEALSGSVRRANAQRTLKKQEQADKAAGDDEDAMEAELGMAQEAEAENERNMADISENEILGRGLLGMFTPLLLRVVANEGGQYNHPLLLQASMLALCKCMCVSRQFCEKHLPLLFTALAQAPEDDTTLRANTVVALGDLAFRFPNEVEPYTPRLYARLRDGSTKVRRHTLMVLTHLILNDMVKVKGQVCEIAMCLRDDDSRIRDLTRLLFHELSKRSNNPVYNLLPDIISQLSQQSIRKEDFRSIMSFLLGFIKKDRQNEMLVEKLCQRYPKCENMSQKADLTYCMAQLKLNEKAIKCLADNFKLYKDSLYDEDVQKSFGVIVTKAKKILKPELKQFLEEWEHKLTDSAELGTENEAADRKAMASKVKAQRRAARRNRVPKEPLGEAVNEDREHQFDELSAGGDE